MHKTILIQTDHIVSSFMIKYQCMMIHAVVCQATLFFRLQMIYLADLVVINILIFTVTVKLVYPRRDLASLKHSLSIFWTRTVK